MNIEPESQNGNFSPVNNGGCLPEKIVRIDLNYVCLKKRGLDFRRPVIALFLLCAKRYDGGKISTILIFNYQEHAFYSHRMMR